MIKKCPNCKPHAFQDATYGTQMRVFTKGVKAEHRSCCTVCGNENKPTITKK